MDSTTRIQGKYEKERRIIEKKFSGEKVVTIRLLTPRRQLSRRANEIRNNILNVVALVGNGLFETVSVNSILSDWLRRHRGPGITPCHCSTLEREKKIINLK